MDAKLTIGMACYDDFERVYFTVQALRLYHAPLLAQCELLIVDNHPHSPHGQAVQGLVQWVQAGQDLATVRYDAYPSPVGTAAPRQRVFERASAPWVLCLDSHVLLAPGALAALLAYSAAHPASRDLLSGPMIYDNLTQQSNYFADQWRGEMHGTWATDPRGLDPQGPPFPIPGMGLGAFACRKEAWPGFHPGFRGFGGEELYIHEKVRRAGGQCLCLPAFRWVHRFGRPAGTPYPLQQWHKVRNYVLGHTELGWPLDRLRRHFVEGVNEDGSPYTGRRLPEAEWAALVADPVNPPEQPPGAAAPASGCRSCQAPVTLEEWYSRVAATSSDINEHCPRLRQLASQCAHVTEFGVRHGVSTVALLAGQPQELVSYDLVRYPEVAELERLAGATRFTFHQADAVSATIAPTDLLVIDTRHTAAQLTAELRHATQVRRWLVLHDTATFGERGEDGGPGLLPALRTFLRAQPEWTVLEHDPRNNGLTVLTRDPADQRPLPSVWERARNYARSSARYLARGLPVTSEAAYEARLDACALCPVRSHGHCAACGCPIEDKAARATEDCPFGRWPPASA